MTVTNEEHTFKRYDHELSSLQTAVLEMGGLVEEQVRNAVKALRNENLELARDVVFRDANVNRLDVKSDEQVVDILARFQPVASDLRKLSALSKTVTDLERIGDEAKKIARMTIRIYDSETPAPKKKLFRDVKPMSKVALGMLRDSLDALARLDVEKAVYVTQEDDELDSEFGSAIRRLLTYMFEDPRMVGHVLNTVFVVKALERIGDHAKNISEYVIYLVKGKDVRHLTPEAIASDVLSEN